MAYFHYTIACERVDTNTLHCVACKCVQCSFVKTLKHYTYIRMGAKRAWVWESVSAFPHISHARVSATSCNISHAGRLTASEAAWECERELDLPFRCRHKYREDAHILHTHTHKRTARSAATERAILPNTPHTLAKKARLVCFSFSHVSFWGCSFSQPFAGVEAPSLSQLKTRCCCVWFVQQQQLTVSRSQSLHMRNVTSRV